MTTAKPAEKKVNTQQEPVKKQKQAAQSAVPVAQFANAQTQKPGTPATGNANRSGSKGTGQSMVPAVHGSQSAYAQGSELIYQKLLESLALTGDLNHPDTKKREEAYINTLSIDQVKDYYDMKSTTAQELKAAPEPKKDPRTQQPAAEIVLQAGGTFRPPVVYRQKKNYVVDFNAGQTDYDGSAILNEAQFDRFMERVLTESEVVLPQDKPSQIILKITFIEAKARLKSGSTITYHPHSAQDKAEKEIDGGKDGGDQAGKADGKGSGTKSDAELKREYGTYPESVRNLIRVADHGAPLTPAEKIDLAEYILKNLNIIDLLDYTAKVGESTMNIAEFKASIQRYIKDKQDRDASQKARVDVEARISKSDFKALYAQYKDFKESESQSKQADMAAAVANNPLSADNSAAASANAAALAAAERMVTKSTQFTKALNDAGYGEGIAQFEAVIHKYEAAFEQEALNTALDQLEKYRHILFEEQKRLENPVYLKQLLEQVKATGAAELYNEGNHQIAAATRARRNGEATEITVDYEKRDQGERIIDKADAAITSIPNDLVKEKQFDKAELAAISDINTLKKFMTEYIAEKRKSIDLIENKVIKDPNTIYGMDLLFNICKRAQGVTEGSILDEILTDKKKSNQQFEWVKNLSILFGAIVLTIASAGTGTLALVALGANFALSAYVVYETIDTYKNDKAGYNVGVLSDDPSLLWVIVAIAGAAMDAAALGKAFKAAEPIAVAAKEFNDDKIVANLVKRLEKIEGLDRRIIANIEKQAKVEAQYASMLKSAAQTRNYMFSSIPFLKQTGELIAHMIFIIRKGILTFDEVLLKLKAAHLIKDLSNLSKTDISILEEAFAKAKTLQKDDNLATELEKALADRNLSKVSELAGEGHIPVQEIENKFPHEPVPEGDLREWTVKNGLIVGPKGDPIHAPGSYNFIIDAGGNIKIGEKHAFLADNASVQAAGSITIKGGKVKSVDNLSGHYKPTLDQALHYEKIFQKAGLRTDGVQQTIYKIEQNEAGEVTKRTVIKTLRW